jgi:hypothetical protein
MHAQSVANVWADLEHHSLAARNVRENNQSEKNP